MKSSLTQKELYKMVIQFGISISPLMSKKNILSFLTEASKGNNVKWVPVLNKVMEIEKSIQREIKLNQLLGK